MRCPILAIRTSTLGERVPGVVLYNTPFDPRGWYGAGGEHEQRKCNYARIVKLGDRITAVKEVHDLTFRAWFQARC